MVPDRLRSCSRRRFLRASAAALPVALAGCSSSCPDSSPPTPSAVVRPDDEPSGRLPRAAVETDWPAFRHDRRNTGFGDSAAPPDGVPSIAWRTDVPAVPGSAGAEGPPSAPVLAGGTLSVVDGDGALRAFDARDGTERWAVETTTARQAPTVDPSGGLLVVAGEEGVVAVDLPGEGNDPTIRWRADLSATASAVIGSGRAFVPIEDALVALDAATGEEDWRAGFDGPVTRPALVGDSVLATAARLRALDAGDGSERWQAGSGGVSAFPVVDADAELAYHGSYDGLTAVDLATGETRWQFARGDGRGYDAPVVTPDTLYTVELVGEGPDAIYALDPDTGEPEPRWCSWLGEGTVAAAGPEHVLVQTPVAPDRPASEGYALQALRRETGAATWQFRAPRPVLPPALGDGAAFVVTEGGTVCALGNGGDDA